MSCCKINAMKQKQIQFAKQKINKQLDILYIVSKLQEIDKLKMLVLGKEQLQVFDYLPKPSVPLDVSAMALIQNQYFSILNPPKASYEKTLEAQMAFTKILKDPFNSINQKLLESMDFETAQLLKSRKNFEPRNRFQSEEEVNSEISKSISFPARSPHQMIKKSNIRLSSQ